MKLPLSWLREFLTLEADTQELCRRLTMAGLEVEAVDQLTPSFTDVFVAKVLGVQRHPNADRLSVCDVDAGAAGRFHVVCGAPNVHTGMIAALARVGARLGGGVHGQGSGSLEDAVPLQAATIRGVPSEGMLCSESELGLSKDHEGIVELDREGKPGQPLQSYLELPDVVLDIAITPNRGDCLSIQGLAREIAALFGVRCKPPRLRPVKAPASPDSEGCVSVSVELRAPELCPRYAALAMGNVKLGISPVWMRRRLELCGMRPVNNVVDVTNYVMIEIGQPLHAFDLAQIVDCGIIVRRAGDDREFETLDGIRRNLEADDLLIADRDKVLAIAGVMGGRNSEVSTSTNSIILESAYFEPITIARTARRMNLRSEASYRFERGIDRAGQVNGILRAAELMRRVAGAKEASVVIDIEPQPRAERRIELEVGSLNSLLGFEVPPAEIKRRLKALGAAVEAAGHNRFTVIAPSFRPDMNEPADLAEEVARLAGLAEIPATLPLHPTVAGVPNSERSFVRKLRQAMIGCGMVEAKTIAFIAPADNERFPGFFSEAAAGRAEAVRVVNPLSAELSELRLSLLPGLLAALRFNLNREENAFHAFEIAKVFSMAGEASSPVIDVRAPGLPSPRGIASESQRIAGVSYGDYAMGGVDHPAIQAGFLTVKGVLEACLLGVGIRDTLVFEPLTPEMVPYLHPGCAAQISCGGAVLGMLGELHPAESLRLELSSPCVVFELDLPKLMTYSTARAQVVAPPRFPAIRRDLALLLDREFPAGRVVRTISDLHAPLLESVELFDVYQGDSIPAGKKSVALACRYRAKDRTLTDEEVNRAHNLLVEQAKARLGAQSRA
jgi:phenylalanyl-tRNA synthetase beta chain